MVRHMYQRAGLDLCTAVRMASVTPVTILGLEGDFGSLEEGKRADILMFDDQIEIRRVFVGGEEVLMS